MEDNELVALFLSRDETAIENTGKQYGRLFRKLARNILRSEEDVEECVNDTLLALWNRIPPDTPDNFTAYSCRILKNTALKKARYNAAGKRNPEYEISLSELSELCEGKDSAETEFDAAVTSSLISDFLRSLNREKRYMFLRRYWYHDDIPTIAKAVGTSEGRVRTALSRIRKALSEYLKKEGVPL